MKPFLIRTVLTDLYLSSFYLFSEMFMDIYGLYLAHKFVGVGFGILLFLIIEQRITCFILVVMMVS